MSPLFEGGILSGALLVGGAIGWIFGLKTGWRMPSIWISFVVLMVGSLGGPLLTYTLMGQNLASYIVALLIAGFASGWVFWPMGQRQGEKEWL